MRIKSYIKILGVILVLVLVCHKPWCQSDFQVTQNPLEDTLSSYHNALSKARSYDSTFPDSGLVWIQQAHQQALLANDTFQQIESLIILSQFQFWNAQLDDAMKSILSADSIFQQHPVDTLELDLLYRKAENFEYTAHPKKGMAVYEACYLLANKRQDFLMLNRLDIKFGNIYRVTKAYNLAENYFQKAIARNMPTGPIYEHAHTKAVLEYYDMIIEENWSPSGAQGVSDCCDTLSIITTAIARKPHLHELKLSFLDLQLNCILNGIISPIKDFPFPGIQELKSSTSNTNKFQNQLDLYTALAIQNGDFQTAKTYSDTSWLFAQASENLVLQINSASLRKDILKASGNFQSAIRLMEFVDSCQQVLSSNERIQSIQQLESKIQKKEIEWQHRELENDRKLLVRRNHYFLISSIIFIAISFLAFYFYFVSQKRNEVISQKNQELEQLNQTKDHIFAVIAHDLRKPALAFRGITKKVNYLLKKKEFDTLNKLGLEIEKDAKSLNQLTDNLLHWALLQNNILPNRPELISLENTFKLLQEVFHDPLQEKNIVLNKNFESTFEIYIDPSTLQIIFYNLLDNAIKYTPQNGSITISTKVLVEKKLIQIQDTGIGIPEDLIPSLFLLSREKSTEGILGEKGTGLGLHLVKELVKLNEGTISVKSQIQKGTTFTIEFKV